MKNLFKPEDFDGLAFRTITYKQAEIVASVAQRILSDYLEKEGLFMSGMKHDGEWFFSEEIVGKQKPGDTHTALLVDIKEIEEKKCVEHKVALCRDEASNVLVNYMCSVCGVKLRQVFKEE